MRSCPPRELVGKKDGEAAVEAHEEHLLHDPDAVAEALSRLPVRECLGVHARLRNAPEALGIDYDELGGFCGIECDIEGDHGHDARGGEDAAFSRSHAEECDLLAGFIEKVGTERPRKHEDHAGAARAGALHVLAGGEANHSGTARKVLLLGGDQVMPKGDALREQLFDGGHRARGSHLVEGCSFHGRPDGSRAYGLSRHMCKEGVAAACVGLLHLPPARAGAARRKRAVAEGLL